MKKYSWFASVKIENVQRELGWEKARLAVELACTLLRRFLQRSSTSLIGIADESQLRRHQTRFSEGPPNEFQPHAVTTWLDINAGTAPRRLIASLLRRSNLPTALTWLAISQAENTAFSPNWYESLTDEMRATLKSLFVSNADPLDLRQNQLKNCPDFIADWHAGTTFGL